MVERAASRELTEDSPGLGPVNGLDPANHGHASRAASVARKSATSRALQSSSITTWSQTAIRPSSSASAKDSSPGLPWRAQTDVSASSGLSDAGSITAAELVADRLDARAFAGSASAASSSEKSRVRARLVGAAPPPRAGRREPSPSSGSSQGPPLRRAEALGRDRASCASWPWSPFLRRCVSQPRSLTHTRQPRSRSTYRSERDANRRHGWEGRWSGRRGSNPRHSAWEADTLPTELLPLGRARVYRRGAGRRNDCPITREPVPRMRSSVPASATGPS